MRPVLRLFDGVIERLPFPRRFVRFCVVGASGVVVNLGTLGLLYAYVFPASWGPWQHRAAAAGAIAVAMVTNFILNDMWTWGDGEKKGTATHWFLRFAKFSTVCSAGAFVQWSLTILLYEQAGLGESLGTAGLFVAQAVGILAAMSINFVANHFWTFRKRAPAESQVSSQEPPA